MNRVDAIKRITREYVNDVANDPSDYWTIEPDETNCFHWTGTIQNIPSASHRGEVYTLDILFPEQYPFKPPKVRFTNSINNRFVNPRNGEICLDILREAWSPALTIGKVLIGICSLLADDNCQVTFGGRHADLAQRMSKMQV
jgi:ubiquitin-conjugating enzyme E2 D/E